MNLVLVCGHCSCIHRCIDVSGEADVLVGNRSEFWPDNYVCPNCGESVVGQPEESLPSGFHNDRIRDLNPQELLMAMSGMGLPEERTATIAAVKELLLNQRVKTVSGDNLPNTLRCIVHHLEMEDGTRIYLGASSHGATIYKITRPHNYTKRALDDSSTG